MKHLLNSKLKNHSKSLLNLTIMCLLALSLSCEQKSTGNIQFDDVENPPVLPGCNNLSQAQTKQCFIGRITEFIRIEFNSDITMGNASPTQKIDVAFTVDEKGVLSNIDVTASSTEIKEEIVRLLKKIPKMKPASQNGKDVAVNCAFPVVFETKD